MRRRPKVEGELEPTNHHQTMSNHRQLHVEQLPNQDLYAHLATAIAPRPICFASTVDAAGRVNLSPYSFFNVFSSNPPVLVFSPVRSGRDGSTKDTLDNVRATQEVVINVVDFSMVEQMSLASTAYPKGVNEFEKAGFTEAPSAGVRPPRVAESPVSFECTVDRVLPLGEEGGAGNLVLARVQTIHIREDLLGEDGKILPQRLDLVGRMGGNAYVRASGAALFEVKKPTRQHGIGVDRLPEGVRNSNVLTGNDLGKLGGLPELPTEADLIALRADPEIMPLLRQPTTREVWHRYAQTLMGAGDTARALRVLTLAEVVVR